MRLIELRLIMIAIIIVLFIFIISMLRKQKMELKYCLLWIAALLGIMTLCIFPNLLDKLSELLGIGVPVNALFLVCIAFLACICISLTVVVSRLSDRLRKLTQNIAILEVEAKKNDETVNQMTNSVADNNINN